MKENGTTTRKPIIFGKWRYERETQYYSPYPAMQKPKGTPIRKLYYDGELVLKAESRSDGCGGTECFASPRGDISIDIDEYGDNDEAYWSPDSYGCRDLDRTIKLAIQAGEMTFEGRNKTITESTIIPLPE